MFASFLITFRETLEAALIVGIVLSFLYKTKQWHFSRIIYLAVAAGIGASLLGAWLFNTLAGGFSGRNEQIFEGFVMIIGAVLITTMIIWILREQKAVAQLKNKVSSHVADAKKFSLFLVVFVAILREGIETVIFLSASSLASSSNVGLAATAGILVAIILGYIIFATSIKVNLKHFFNFSSLVLIMFAAGLFAHGVQELQTAHILPIVIGQVWDINPAIASDGSYPLLHEKGIVGSILKGLFGYNGNPTLLETSAYILYIFFIVWLWKFARRFKTLEK